MDADNRVVLNCGGIRHEVYKVDDEKFNDFDLCLRFRRPFGPKHWDFSSHRRKIFFFVKRNLFAISQSYFYNYFLPNHFLPNYLVGNKLFFSKLFLFLTNYFYFLANYFYFLANYLYFLPNYFNLRRLWRKSPPLGCPGWPRRWPIMILCSMNISLTGKSSTEYHQNIHNFPPEKHSMSICSKK